jgi:hypothetical protein
MKNKKKLFTGASALMALIAIIIVLMPAPDEVFETQIEFQTPIEIKPVLNLESPAMTAPPTTAPAEIKLIPVEEPMVEEIIIEDEIIIEVTESLPIPQTAPPPPQEAQTPPPGNMPEDTQGTDEYGNIYKIEDGQKYVWDDVLGWGRDNGRGTVTIMDAQTSGYRFFVGPCGIINLSKIVTPTGEIISYEEYQRRKGIVPQPLPIFEFEEIPWNEKEQQYKFENGERHIWDSVLGWGTDTLSSGQDVFIEIDGEAFTWNEYIAIVES